MNFIQKGCIKINISAMLLLKNILITMLGLDFLSILILGIDYMNMISNGHSAFSIEEYFFLLVLLLQLIMIIYIFIKWINKYYVFCEESLVYYSGIIFKKKQEFVLNKIGCTSFEQSLFGKIFNYGTIIIYVQNRKFSLQGIHNPHEFIKLLGSTQ